MNLKHELGVKPHYKCMSIITPNIHTVFMRALRLKFIAATKFSEMKNFIRDHF